MTAETFFEKFELLASAPNAIDKLRASILRLAFAGRFSEGNGKWNPSVLGDVATITMGNSPPGESYNDRGEGVPLVNGPVEFSAGPFGTTVRTKFTTAPTKFCERGDLLICVRGSTTGRTNIAAFRACIGRGVAAISAGDSQPFVNLFMWHCRQAIFDMGTGSTFPSISYDDLADLKIAVPPLAEQTRIVAKVDELMALCDRLEAQQKEREAKHAVLARAALARFAEAPTPTSLGFLFNDAYSIDSGGIRQAILTLAVKGGLVTQDGNDESAQNLVARSAAEKTRLVAAKEIKPEAPSEPISDEEMLFSIPQPWIWVRAGDLCRPISSGSTPDKSVFHATEGIPYLKVYNIRNQLVDFGYKPQFISGTHHKKEMKRSQLRPGDVIMNIVGPPLGKVAIVPDTYPEWNCNQAIAFFKPIVPAIANWFYLFIREGSFLANIQLIGTAGQDNISVTKCKYIPVPLPPLAEQRRIVAKVDQLMALVDRLEAQLAESRALGERLMEAVVAELTAAEPATAARPVVELKPASFDLFGQPDQSEQYLRNGATVAAMVIKRLGKKNGKTFVEKNLHVVESYCDVPMGRAPRRMERGPADLKQHDAIMDWAAEADIFLSESSEEGERVEYIRGDAFDTSIANAGQVLSDKLEAVKSLIAKLCPLSSKQSEWIATVYGSWNDFIKDKIKPTDEQIIDDIYQNWHISKQQVSERDWRWALNWLNENKVIPTGKGPRVSSAP